MKRLFIIISGLLFVTPMAVKATKYFVTTYANVANPQGIPSAWPAIVQEGLDTDPDRASPTLNFATLASYNAYVASHQSEYDAWAAGVASNKLSNLITLSNQYDNAISGLATFLAIPSPTQGQTLAQVQLQAQILQKILPFIRAQYLSSLQ